MARCLARRCRSASEILGSMNNLAVVGRDGPGERARTSTDSGAYMAESR